MWRDTQFNTLVYFTDKHSINSRRRGAGLQDAYVRQALGLARSLSGCGKVLRVFTNNRELFQSLIPPEVTSPNITLAGLDLALDIPRDIGFYAAHHKLCLFSRFSQESGLNCLLDVDVIANGANASLADVLEEASGVDGWVYDISGQVFPAYGTRRVQGDLRALGVVNAFPRWFGGEFLLGNPRFFSYLDTECRALLPRYLEVYLKLHHVGDEALISAVLNDAGDAVRIADVGASGLIVRYWSGKTLHVQNGHSSLLRAFLWHLPDSKELLESFHKHGNTRSLYRRIRLLQMAKQVHNCCRKVCSSIMPEQHPAG
jgi:hypothetical protein